MSIGRAEQLGKPRSGAPNPFNSIMVLFYYHYIMPSFYINLKSSEERRGKFKNVDGIERWDAVSRDEITPELDKRMRSMPAFPRPSHLGRCGCFASHVSLYEHIVREKINNVLILEDDAVLVNSIPSQYPLDGIIYLGGFFHRKKMTDNTPTEIKPELGINKLDDEKYRVLMLMSYIVPTWQVASQILDYINSQKFFKAIDIMLGNSEIPVYYNYPASFVEEGSESTIAKKNKRSDENYDWVTIAKTKDTAKTKRKR